MIIYAHSCLSDCSSQKSQEQPAKAFRHLEQQPRPQLLQRSASNSAEGRKAACGESKPGKGPRVMSLWHVVSPSALNTGTKRLEITRRIRHCALPTHSYTFLLYVSQSTYIRASLDTMKHLPDELVLHIISCTYPEIPRTPRPHSNQPDPRS
jgi:hypothetical protein